MDALTVVVGLVGLWLGTKLTISGAVSIAQRLGISEFVIGVAILSVGSDLPELAIAIDASIKNVYTGAASDVVVGTAIGSALAQIGFVLGIVGLFGFLTMPKKVIYRHGSVMLGAIVLLTLAAIDGLVSRTEGASLAMVYIAYFAYLVTDRNVPVAAQTDERILSVGIACLYVLFGIAAVTLSSEITVDAAIRMANALSINKTLISIFLIGLGSSLPELSISFAAIMSKRVHLSVGNLIGSNIFDTLIPIGVGAAISPLLFGRELLIIDLPALFLLSVVVLLFFLRKKGIQRQQAAVVLGIYLVYAFLRMSVEF